MKTLGIPHPPGTPLYIIVGNVWARIFGPVLGFAYSINLLSAVSTATACGLLAFLFARWTRDSVAAVAGGIAAGLMSGVWKNATETEVYAPSLLFSVLLLVAADNARLRREARWVVLLAYLSGLAWSLQLSALVSAPAALVLAVSFARESSARGRAWIPLRSAAYGLSGRMASVLPLRARAMAAVALGASAVLFMLVRAAHDPGINQGNPATWDAFKDVITRAQYQPVSLLPRQAPWYLQIGNLFEYADWQIALGMAPDPPPSIMRTPFTIAFALLGIAGFLWHRRIHRVSARVMLLLLVTSTLGVIAYLNMKTSPSFGHGFLPAGATHEARERDYFFALAFVCWGLWAGAGAVRMFSFFGERWRAGAFGIVLIPGLFNWSAVDRRSEPGASEAHNSAVRMVTSAPERAVMFAYGDNDTYPVWYLQQVEGVRRDVTLVTLPLLAARWYREELARRHSLLDSGFVEKWRGREETLAALCAAARGQGRATVSRVEVSRECE